MTPQKNNLTPHSDNTVISQPPPLVERPALPPEDIARPVLACIEGVTDTWYEVVYWNGEQWRSYAGSDTFATGGDRVMRWRYADEAIEL